MSEDLDPLSEREIEVLKLVADGKTNQQIARALVISPNTVKVHLRNIFEKLGVQSRTEATMEAVRRGWVTVGGELPTAGAGEATPPPAEAIVEPIEEPLGGPPPLATWQRIYMVLVAVLLAGGLLASARWQVSGRDGHVTPFSDSGRVQSGIVTRNATARWIVRAPLPVARSRMAVATDDVRLYVIAGETAGGLTDQVLVYDRSANLWRPAAAKPTAVANIAAVRIGGRFYVAGGTLADGRSADVLEVYDPQADVWEARARLPFPLAAYAAAALEGRLYLFGGWDGTRWRVDTLIYDPVSDRWSNGSAMPGPRGFHAASALKGRIYVVGGFDGRRELADVLVYDPTAERTAAGPWSPRAALNRPRGGLGLVTLGARLYAIGGGWTGALSFNEQYDATADAWSQIETPITGQWRNLGVAALGNKIYALGGWGGSYLDNNEEYQALLQQLLPLFTKGQ